ncbi:alpha/beta fold hydrolase [Magnetospirillum aberrantis]|uniref:Alpha/beta fold hydrolase n=1 Tax=Magnetospirillum aberrantis SpK TaxID=908842 RepID=A0A7C9QU70_9PROT|nr:alpha/beta fold hydrolase [Magnetospirillum aberrantis]NFV80179.1 alpha/beta fold hydrolase [Magnetospirillum aberrantis SpK]
MTPTVVLLPGLLNDYRLWAAQTEALSPRARVVVADLTLDDSLAAMSERVLSTVPGRFALAGLSMGGYVAMDILRRAPDRVERLALVDTTARPDAPEQTQRRKDAVEIARSGGFEKIMPSMLPMLVHPDHLALARVGGLAKDMARAVGAEAFARQQNAIMHRPDARPGLSRVACPTLVVVGADDALTPLDRAEEMADLIPDARLEVVENCGHLSPLEQPDAVSLLLKQWLFED